MEENFRLELTELEGNILEGQNIIINAAGIHNGGLRNSRDGCSYFGYVKGKV